MGWVSEQVSLRKYIEFVNSGYALSLDYWGRLTVWEDLLKVQWMVWVTNYTFYRWSGEGTTFGHHLLDDIVVMSFVIDGHVVVL